MRHAHRRPAGEDLLAVRVRGGRQDRRRAGAIARSRPAGSASNPGISGRNSPAPTSATGPGMAESLQAPCPNPGSAATLARHDHPPALDARRTVIGSGAVFLDGTIVNAALKHIGQELPASLVGVLEGQAYIVSGYLAVLAALLILAGALSDHYGRRRVYAIGLAGFAATSALCGLAPTLEWLVVFRLAPGRRRARCSSRARWPSSPTPSTDRSAAGRSASGRPRPRR